MNDKRTKKTKAGFVWKFFVKNASEWMIGMNTDWECYEAFLAGNTEGFEQLVLRYKNPLIYFLCRYVEDVMTAEDLAQDAFVEVYVHKERFEKEKNFKTYLFTIGRNKAVDYLRKHKDVTALMDELPEQEDESQELERLVLRKEQSKILAAAMKKLKQEYQLVITLVDLEDMSYADAAKVLKKTLPQIKVLLHRARKALARQLEREGYVHEVR